MHWLDHIIWSNVNNGVILHLIRNILNFSFNTNHNINTCWYLYNCKVVLSPKKTGYTQVVYTQNIANFVITCINKAVYIQKLIYDTMTKINLWTLTNQLIPNHLSYGLYHGQQMWLSQQQMKSTKDSNPNRVVNLLEEMEKIWTSYSYNDFFNFPSNFWLHYRVMAQSSQMLKYSISPSPNRNPKHIRLELNNIPQWPALMTHLSLSSFSSWGPDWVTNTKYFQKLKLFDSKVGSNFLDCQFHGLVGSRLYHASQFRVQNEANFRPLCETIPWSGYSVQFWVLTFFLK